MKNRLLMACYLLFVCSIGAFSADNAMAPNLSIYVSQRIFPPSKSSTASLSTFNLKSARLAIYDTTIEALVPNAAVINAADNRKDPNSVAGRLAKMDLTSPRIAWTEVMKKTYPNNWAQQIVKLPRLSSGVYVLEAKGGGITVRTWFAVSMQVLLVKRSPDVVKAWLVNSEDGKPAANAAVAAYDVNGRLQTVHTSADGIAVFSAVHGYQPIWIATRGGEPAFARASAPEQEKPYLVFMYSDRPIYRPGQLVRFRGTVRAVHRGEYSLPTDKSLHVQIKTRGDTVVYDEHLPLSAFGSFAGDFQLAPVPPLGTYTLEVALAGSPLSSGSGDGSGEEYREYYSFEVQAYRKPEFEVTGSVAKPYYLGGTTIPVTIGANYFFGSPVAGAKVKYAVRFEATSSPVPTPIFTAAGLGSAAIGQPEESYTGQGRLDAKGKLELQIPTRSLPYDRSVSVSAEVTDLSQRTQSGAVSTQIMAALYKLSLARNPGQYLPGETVAVTANVQGYDDKPVQAPVTITLVEHLQDREHRPYEKRTPYKVTTDKDGRGTIKFKVLRPGYYTLEAWGLDTQGNVFYAMDGFTVVEKRSEPAWPMLEISFDKESYTVGETALLRVRTSLVGSSALLTVEGERLYRFEVHPLTGKDFIIKLPVVHAYQPGVLVRLTAFSKGAKVFYDAVLNAPAVEKTLAIEITPNKNTYQPGEKAVYDVATRDYRGRGVAAELGLGVVDAAIYAIMPDNTPNPYGVFWHPQAQRVMEDYSLEATYPGGGYQQIPHDPMTPTPQTPDKPIRVRKLFVDTAFWASSLITDANGHGQVSFTVPDNLTTWRATARGLTVDTSAGDARAEVKVTLPLLVRLTLPRFYVRNDEGTIAAIVHNYTGTERKTKVTLSAEGAQIDGATEQEITLPADGIQRLTWKVKINGITGLATDQVRFLVSADGGEGATDAIENTLPVYPDGVKRVEANAGMSGDSASLEMALPANTVPGSASIDLTVSPSLAGPIFEALDYLVEYPHGCAEQTMSSFLPDIIVTRTLHELGVKRPEPPMLKRYVSFGLQKLLRYQHGDGGWNWWEFDQSDPFMTAYVVYGLAQARDAGYPLAAGPLPRGVDYLRRALENTPERTAATYLLLAMAYADQWDDNTLNQAINVARRLINEHEKMDTFSRASLALALAKMSHHPKAPDSFLDSARFIAGELEAKAVQTGTATHWTANAGGGGSWLDSDVEVTAQVLLALLAVKPQSTAITPAVRWLMAAREGKSWNSTKDTASAVLALTAYLKQAKELAPNETVAVRINDRDVRSMQFTAEQVFGEPVHLTIPAASLHPGNNVVRLAKEGAGNIYWTAHLNYVIPAEGITPLEKGIHIKREYRVVAEDPVNAGTQTTGSLVEVTATITCDQHYRYAMLQEPVPAGCEIVGGEYTPSQRMFPGIPGNDFSGYYGCDYQEQWDDRLIYYFDYLPKGEQTITYWLRTEAPGSYRIRPGTAELVYFPEVRGEERLVHIKINEE